jgi:hypothetical protein
MVVVFSFREALAKARKVGKILLVLVVVFYLLFKIISLYSNVLHGPPVPSEPVVEKPLRVLAPLNQVP